MELVTGLIHLIAKTINTVEMKKIIMNFKIHLKIPNILCLNDILFVDDFFVIDKNIMELDRTRCRPMDDNVKFFLCPTIRP